MTNELTNWLLGAACVMLLYLCAAQTFNIVMLRGIELKQINDVEAKIAVANYWLKIINKKVTPEKDRHRLGY